MRTRIIIMSSLLTLAGFVVSAPASRALERAPIEQVTLDRPHGSGDRVILEGQAPALAVARIVRLTDHRWSRVAVERTGVTGHFRVKLPRPTDAAWVVRAASGGTHSRQRTITPGVGGTTYSDACGPGVRKPDGTYWTCSFQDDFSGSALDTTKWVPQRTSATGVVSGSSCFLAAPEDIAVAGGTLTLSARHLAAPITCVSPYGNFLTDRVAATVTTKGLFNQAYGRFSFRAQLGTTRVPGAHSALWLYPDRPTYGPWPSSGEVDVAEWFSALPGLVFPSLHYTDGASNVHSGRAAVADVSQWHVYTVEWTPTTMRFFYDGALVNQQSWLPAAPLHSPQPFDRPFNVVLSQAWGQLWNAPVAATPATVQLKVDYVRVWK